ncbi:hypothetical protein GCM10010464_10230 [Pseudonocardia yunnanensis]
MPVLIRTGTAWDKVKADPQAGGSAPGGGFHEPLACSSRSMRTCHVALQRTGRSDDSLVIGGDRVNM